MFCSICLEDKREGECVTLNPCDHSHCNECWTMWNKENNTCPLCRTDVSSYKPANYKNALEKVNMYMREFEFLVRQAGLDKKTHQIDGMNWCLQRELMPNAVYGSKAGGLIADEMGLGKTVLSVGLIYSNLLPRTLIVVPPSLLSQWESQIYKFTGHSPLIYHGVNRKTISDEELESAPIVLTTYFHTSSYVSVQEGRGEFVLKTLHKIKWDRVIFDEAHHMRNKKNNFFGARRLKTDICWLLTGTPIHNKLSDVQAYFMLLNVPQHRTWTRPLVEHLVRNLVLRRTKEEANLELPTLREHIVEVDWETSVERDFSEQFHSAINLFRVSRNNVAFAIRALANCPLAVLTRCRQACIYPEILKKPIEALETSNQDMTLEYGSVHGVDKKSKMNAVVKTLVERKDNGRKKLVFCHYRREIDYICGAMTENKIDCNYFDGRVSSANRQTILNESPDVLILQMKTACEGLNLQQYQEVYFVSPHWNPSVEDQAIGRCHRIGQKNEIDVFRYAMKNFSNTSVTLDQFCLDIQTFKRDLRSVIDTK